MSSHSTTNTMSSIKNWSINRASQTFVNCAVIISVCWTWNASFSVVIPMIWRIAWNASVSWIIWWALRTFTPQWIIIECWSKWTGKTFFCYWVVKVIILTSYTNWSIPYWLRSWARWTCLKLLVVMSIYRALFARFGICIPISWPVTRNTNIFFC